MGEEEAVQVAVRMRIFNQREKDANATRIIRMTREAVGSKTFITNPDTDEEKEFKFDYSFNTHLDDPSVGPYANQDTVFDDLGKPVLLSALEGRNVCLFAYGQTGAGKSFSMLGKNEPPSLRGIIPRTCNEIFKIRNDPELADKENEVLHEIVIEVMEIYCEQVNDLLANRKVWPPKGHAPRPHPKGGFHCKEITSTPCNDYAGIEDCFLRADRNRSVGSHALNPESSRAHTIYKIEYTKTTIFAELPPERNKQMVTAQLNLVDLAGSERMESAGTSGQMLKEGNAINLSLTALGNTIKALTSVNEKPQFRNSKLTMLLMQSMTSGKVIMIAAVSPASICYDESISTLRFAERIKLVKIKVAKNVTIDPVAEIRKQMEEMRDRMQQEIDDLKTNQTEGDPAAMDALKRAMEEQRDQERQMREDAEQRLKQLEESREEREKRLQDLLAEQNKGWEGVFVGKSKDLTVPHLLNLNEDARLAETLVYPIDKPEVTCGRANPASPPVLEFNGMGIMKDHCVFEYDEANNTVILKPNTNSRCMVNGKLVTEPTPLKHNNRVWLGNNYAMRLAIPGKEEEGDQFPDTENNRPDYFVAESEVAEAQAPPKKDNEDGTPESAQDAHLRHQLNEALKKIEQANIIASDLDRDAMFSPKIIKNRDTKEDMVVVNVSLPTGNLTWPWDRFNSRLIDMVHHWQGWQHAMANGQTFSLPDNEEENPFIDNGYQLVGEADVVLSSLGNMIENPVDPPVLSVTGVQEGRLKLCLAPLDKNGGEGPWDDDESGELDPFVESADEIKDKEIQFQIHVESMQLEVDLKSGGRPRYKDVFVRYKINSRNGDEEYQETPHDVGGDIKVKFDHKAKFKQFVDEEFYKRITADPADPKNSNINSKVTFQVWGKVAEQKMVPVNHLVVLPPGWKRVTAYQDSDGTLHLEPPPAIEA